MADSQRFVIDSNVLISRLLLPGSAPGHAVRKAMSAGQLLVSDASLEELATVLSRSKFDRYVTIRDRQEFLRMVGLASERIPIFPTVPQPGQLSGISSITIFGARSSPARTPT